MNTAFLRIIDANFNRSREGLRVCEEIARFVLNSPSITRSLKSARHRVSRVSRSVFNDNRRLYASRDVDTDVGRGPGHREELKRSHLGDVWDANIQRTKESIRVLEEFLKLIDKNASATFTELRFDVYDIEKKAAPRIHAIKRPAASRG